MVDLGGVLGGLGEDFGGILGHGRTSKNLWFSFRFLMILASFGGLEGSRRAILVPMLGDVGCKMGPRWLQKGFEPEFFAQLGVLMGILAPRWQDKASQDESEGVVHGGTGVVHGGTGNILGRPAAEAWSLRVHQSQTWSQILLSYHG
jgi:hypothetical protein